MTQIIEERLTEVAGKPIKSGSHPSGIQNGMCIMEAVSYVAGEPWSDTPECACPVIGSFLRSWNDSIPDTTLRTKIMAPLIAKLVGTKATAEIEHRRSLMAADWLVRTHTPAWLRLAGLNAQAEALAGLPEITAMAQVPSIRPAIEAVRKDAAAAWAAAGAGAWDAARAAARQKLAPTVETLQKSALELVERMIACKEG